MKSILGALAFCLSASGIAAFASGVVTAQLGIHALRSWQETALVCLVASVAGGIVGIGALLLGRPFA